MINPKIELSTDMYIHAAPMAVWQKFSDVASWPRWYPNVLGAEWVQGEPWQDGARLHVQVRNSLGVATNTTGIVRMCIPGDAAVWEMTMSSLITVASLRLSEEVGGCKLTLRKTYHGPAAIALLLLRGKQKRMLTQGLQNLKRLIEGSPR